MGHTKEAESRLWARLNWPTIGYKGDQAAKIGYRPDQTDKISDMIQTEHTQFRYVSDRTDWRRGVGQTEQI